MTKPVEEEYRGSVPPPSCGTPLNPQELAGALHEVSNALTVVLGWLEVAQKHVEVGRAAQAVNIALRQARFGYRVARRAIGAASVSPKGSVSVQELVSHSLVAVRPLAERRHIEIVADEIPLPDLHVRNSDAAGQILINLLLNAIAFTPDGTKITVTCAEDTTHVAIAVRDQGPGIDAERAKHLWDAPSSTRKGGAGIGLAYCRALAKEQGGELSVLVGAGGGAFELRWPHSPEVASAPVASTSRGGGLEGLQILLVEDDQAICSLVELAFECQGSRVVSARSLDEVRRAKLVQKRFDLALVDLSPFGADIKGGLAQLRSDMPGMSLILITGSATGLPEGEEASFAAWVRKPFEAGELISTVRQIAGRQSSGG